MSKLYFTGVGSRETPNDILLKMRNIGKSFSDLGYWLRSGGARGADQAFESGWGKNREIFLPWNGYEDRWQGNGYIIPALTEKHYMIAENAHPAWDACSQGARKMHSRNTCQVLGEHLDSPTNLLVCWTSQGRLKGGTAVAIRIAMDNGIPIYNLGRANDLEELRAFYVSLTK